MSTRSSIYYRNNDDEPLIHIYREMLEDSPDDVHLEIDLGHSLFNIRIPEDLQKRLGILATHKEETQ